MDNREFWVDSLQKIALPILQNTANNTLKKNFKLGNLYSKICSTGYLEGVARTLYGIAPFLALDNRVIVSEKEKTIHTELVLLAQKTVANIVDSSSADFCKFEFYKNSTTTHQSIVDTAFLASAIIIAKNVLFDEQDAKTKNNILLALNMAVKQKPVLNNWLLFTATIETCKLYLFGDCNLKNIQFGMQKFSEWYVGDGIYSDGENFKMDYYNSFVIHPMLEEVSRIAYDFLPQNLKIFRKNIITNYQRYCCLQERMIAPDGSYPILGRSICYRAGAFNALARATYFGNLPPALPAPQVHRALNQVLTRMMNSPDLIDKDNFLNVGLFGTQKSLAEIYINRGSLYLCTAIFAPLGLSPKNAFWSKPQQPTTWEKAWSGTDLKADKGI